MFGNFSKLFNLTAASILVIRSNKQAPGTTASLWLNEKSIAIIRNDDLLILSVETLNILSNCAVKKNSAQRSQ